MARESVELVRWAYSQWNGEEMEAMLAHLSPAFEYVSTGLFPGLEPVYRGHQGWLDFWRDYRGIWDSLRIEVDDLREFDEQVVALNTQYGRARDGVEVQRQFANIWSFAEDGTVMRIHAYGDWAEALDAVSVPE